MFKGVDMIYPRSDTGAIKGKTRHINGVGRCRGGRSRVSGHDGLRGISRG